MQQTLNGKPAKYVVNMLTLHKFAKATGGKYLTDIFSNLAFMGELKQGEVMSLEALEKLTKLAYCAIEAAYQNEPCPVDENDVLTSAMKGETAVGEIALAFANMVKEYVEEAQTLVSEKKKKQEAMTATS